MKLSTENLVKTYNGRTVVNEVSFEVNRGEIVGLLGPNGAGKTTSFYMTVGLISPENGNVKLNETIITHEAMYRRAQMGLGYLPQEASIFRHLTVENNIKAILEFTTLTKNPKEIEWKFGKGNTVFGTSNELYPKFDFKTEKGYADVCLKITDSFGCVDEFCDTIKLEDNAFKLILPNVFTPGVDGKNDAFDIDIENYGYYKLTIYNRWGEIVYTSTQDGFGNDEINWNGGYMNSLNKLPNGAYFYLLETKELCDPEAQIQKITGTVTLIREQD